MSGYGGKNAAEGMGIELGAIAHELKAPLAIIAQLAASIEDEQLLGVTPAERKQTLERIRLSAERTLRLVQSLALSQQLAKNDQMFALDLEPLNTMRLCEETIHELLPLAAAHGQTIELRANGRSPLSVGNNELVRSIFINLVDNAIKHNPPETAVMVDVGRHASLVHVRVSDTGAGLRPRDFRQLQETLGRQVQPLHGRSGSSGLGLYIAGTMAEAMGGRLSLRRPKVGLAFQLDLLHSRQLSFLS